MRCGSVFDAHRVRTRVAVTFQCVQHVSPMSHGDCPACAKQVVALGVTVLPTYPIRERSRLSAPLRKWTTTILAYVDTAGDLVNGEEVRRRATLKPSDLFFHKYCGGDLLSHTLSSAVPSAQAGLASGFGMRPGVSLPL